jgi:uncharacterized damage-inducible protein DinB
MQPRPDTALIEIRDVLLETYAVNDAMNQLLLAHLDPRAWRAPMLAVRREVGPGLKAGAGRSGGRTIAAIFAHLHNSRLVWLRDSAPHLKCPAPLDPFRCTMKQAATAHRRSAAQCLRMLEDALSVGAERKVTRFSRGSWTRTWAAGGAMFSYMFAHEAHHRGQIILLAHQLGYRLPVPAAYGIWHWDKLWKQQGLAQRPR